jgi:uncharacterized protein
MRHKPLWAKMGILIACVILAAAIGQLGLVLLAVSQGMSLTDLDLVGLLANPALVNHVKLCVGFNHIMTFIIGPLAYLYIVYKEEWITVLDKFAFDKTLFGLLLIGLWMLYPLMGYLAQLVEQLPLPSVFKDLDQSSMDALAGVLKMDSIWALLFNLVIVGVLPGIGEELLFRGVIQKEIQKHSKSIHTAIWITAFLFAAFHLQIVGFAPKLIIGATLGYAYFLTGNIIVPMALHCINNSMATLSLYFMGGKIDPTTIEASKDSITIFPVLIATTGAFFVWRYIYLHYYPSKTPIA